MKRFLLILSAFLLLFSATTYAENSSFTPNKAIVITEVEGTTATIKFSEKLATTLPKPSTLKSIADAARKKITKAGIKIGDEIGGIVVQNIRKGTNGKYVIMGRSMTPVKNAADDLITRVGKDNVRILDDAYLGGKKFNLGNYKGHKIYNEEGEVVRVLKANDEWTVDMAWQDMKFNPAYRHLKNAEGYINNIDDLKNLPMYKLNKQWTEQVKKEGFEIIDIGNPTNLDGVSLFYNMEKSIMNF